MILNNFLDWTSFGSYRDFMNGFKVRVPDNFNFGYDVVDEWARIEPDRKALLWTDDNGNCRQFTFADMSRLTDATAAFFQSLGIGRGDRVMLMLKRHYQFWLSIVALHKLGATVIPATHLLTRHDIVYRCNRARIKAIVAAGDPVIIGHISESMAECTTVEHLISTSPDIPRGWLDFDKGVAEAASSDAPRSPTPTTTRC